MADGIAGDIGNLVGDVTVPGAAEINHAVGEALGEISTTLAGSVDNFSTSLQVEVAGLSQGAHDQVVEALHDHGPVTEAEAAQLVHDAEAAQVHQNEADALQHEQAKAADRGDYEAAHELAGKAEYELHAAADHGANAEHPIVEAQREEVALDQASWEHGTAHENAVAADSYAQTGDVSHAADYAHQADAHETTAADYGHQGDHGGEYATHDNSHDAAASDASAAAD
jgi:hypothetical protein